MSKQLHILTCLAALTAAATPTAAAVTVGNADGPNCDPFSCGPTDEMTEYQQVYVSSAFPGVLSFDEVSFTMNAFQYGPQMDSATYTVSFYLTSAGVTTLSSNLASNEGSSLGTLGTFQIGGTMPAVLSLSGATISYDPSMGNLLMDVVMSDPTLVFGSYQSFFNADFTQAVTARAWNSTIYGDAGAQAGALQTTFGAVPEPSTWALMLLGFAGLGFAGYRRAKGRAAVAA